MDFYPGGVQKYVMHTSICAYLPCALCTYGTWKLFSRSQEENLVLSIQAQQEKLGRLDQMLSNSSILPQAFILDAAFGCLFLVTLQVQILLLWKIFWLKICFWLAAFDMFLTVFVLPTVIFVNCHVCGCFLRNLFVVACGCNQILLVSIIVIKLLIV